MKIVTFGACVLLVGVACAPDHPTAEAELRQILTEQWKGYAEAHKAGDVTGLGSFFTDSVWLRGPDPRWHLRGREAAEGLLAQSMPSVTVHDITVIIEEIMPFGSHVLESGTWSEELTPTGSDQMQHLWGGYTALWEQQGDGDWKISRMTWNVHPSEDAPGR